MDDLQRLLDLVLHLNRDAGTIGPGMIAQMQGLAARIQPNAPAQPYAMRRKDIHALSKALPMETLALVAREETKRSKAVQAAADAWRKAYRMERKRRANAQANAHLEEK